MSARNFFYEVLVHAVQLAVFFKGEKELAVLFRISLYLENSAVFEIKHICLRGRASKDKQGKNTQHCQFFEHGPPPELFPFEYPLFEISSKM